MKWLAVFFTLFIAFIVIEANSGRMPAFIKQLYDFPGGDLAGHFILMGIMSFLIVSAFASGRGVSAPRVVIRASLVIAILVAIEEISQLFLANRTFSWLDLGFSQLGIICAGALALFFARRRR